MDRAIAHRSAAQAALLALNAAGVLAALVALYVLATATLAAWHATAASSLEIPLRAGLAVGMVAIAATILAFIVPYYREQLPNELNARRPPYVPPPSGAVAT